MCIIVSLFFTFILQDQSLFLIVILEGASPPESTELAKGNVSNPLRVMVAAGMEIGVPCTRFKVCPRVHCSIVIGLQLQIQENQRLLILSHE